MRVSTIFAIAFFAIIPLFSASAMTTAEFDRLIGLDKPNESLWLTSETICYLNGSQPDRTLPETQTQCFYECADGTDTFRTVQNWDKCKPTVGKTKGLTQSQ